VKPLIIAIAATALFGGAAFTVGRASAQTAPRNASAAKPLTIYLAKGRSSLRPIWLAEELGLTYRTEALNDLKTTPAVAPLIKYGNATLTEPAASLAYILSQAAPGKLQPPAGSVAWPDYLVWTHFAQATGMSRVYRDVTRMESRSSATYLPNARPGGGAGLNDTETNLMAIEDYLADRTFFSGAEFGSADILMIGFYENAFFPGLEPRQYARFIDWYGRVTARPAYKRALAKAGPDAAPPRAPANPTTAR